MSIEKQLRSYILQNFLFTEDEAALKNSDSFLGKGLIDSTGIMEVIFFLQEEFGIQVEDAEMIPANLDSVDNILAFVARKKAA